MLFAFGGVGADVEPVTVSASLVCTNPPERPLASKGTLIDSEYLPLSAVTGI
jgi:hypothetical protein